MASKSKIKPGDEHQLVADTSVKIKQKKRNFLVEIVMRKGVRKHKNKKKEAKNQYLED